MDYKVNSCRICGSEDIVKIGETMINGDRYFKYRCNSCQEEFSTVKIVGDAIKAAEIKTKRAITVANPESRGGREVYAKNKNAVVMIKSKIDGGKSVGTGFIVSRDGYVVTNAHVVTTTDGASENMSFKLSEVVLGCSMERYDDELDIVNVDTKLDLAILKYSDETFAYDKVDFGDESDLFNGDEVYAMGNSKGDGLSITKGVVSDKERVLGDNRYIMTDAAVNAGNSGGPLFDKSGKLVGVITSMKKDAVLMNYAIPVSRVKQFILSTEEAEEVKIL